MSFDPNDFEKYPPDMDMDETDVNLRAYFVRMDEDKLQAYDPSWDDDQVYNWEENFTDEGSLLLVCSEREVEIDEYRAVLEQYLEFRRAAGVA